MEEGEEATWEDALDVDDSDLPSLLRPLRPCPLTSLPSQAPLSLRPRSPPPTPAAAEQEAAPPPPHRIPGPAGAVQAAMHRRAAAAAAVQDRGGLLVEGGGDDPLRASGGGTEEVDEDFSQNPWLCALDFLGGSGDASLPHPISSVKSLGSASRVPKLMGIVKSCKPNGLGDLFVTLKDPTGTIGASVHRKVLTEGNLGGDLSVGCVLILKQVAFFSPRRSIVYLNITLNNVDKFFGKDSGSPKRHTLPTLNAKHPPPGKSLVDEMEPVGRSCFLSQESQRCEVGSQSGLAASRTADGGNMERHGCVQACDGEVVKSIYSKRTLDDMQIEHLSGSSMCTSKAVVGFRDVPRASLVRPGADNIYDEEIIQHSNLKGRVDNGTTETPGRRKGGMNAASDPSSLGWGMAPNEEADQVAVEQCGSSSNMVVGCGEDEGPTDYLLCKTSSTSLSNPMLSKPPERVTEPKSMISKVPLAQWTDEQLSELFCDYQDDTDFF